MFILIIILLNGTLLFAGHNLIISEYSNSTGKQALDSVAAPIKEIFGSKFAAYGIEVLDATNSDTREFLSSNSHETILKIKAEGDAATNIVFTIEVGDDRKIYTKQITYNDMESMDQNITVMTVKILHVFESAILSRVQITSDPTFAHIIIDKKVKAVTPWESYLAPGNHDISLELAGYEPLEKKLVVTPGNNRLNFTLMPIGMNDTIIVHEKPLPKEKISSKTLFIISFAGALLAGVAQWQYSTTDKEYDQLISNDKGKYDALDKKAEYSMFLRNTGIVISVSGLCFCTYNRIKNGRWF